MERGMGRVAKRAHTCRLEMTVGSAGWGPLVLMRTHLWHIRAFDAYVPPYGIEWTMDCGRDGVCSVSPYISVCI